MVPLVTFEFHAIFIRPNDISSSWRNSMIFNSMKNHENQTLKLQFKKQVPEQTMPIGSVTGDFFKIH